MPHHTHEFHCIRDICSYLSTPFTLNQKEHGTVQISVVQSEQRLLPTIVGRQEYDRWYKRPLSSIHVHGQNIVLHLP